MYKNKNLMLRPIFTTKTKALKLQAKLIKLQRGVSEILTELEEILDDQGLSSGPGPRLGDRR